MGLNILLVIAVIGLVYYGWRVGVYDATATLVCGVAASLLTFMFYEYLSELFIHRFFTKSQQAADAVSYWILLVLLFVVFRQLATHYFHDERMSFNIYLYRLGGLVAGVLVARVVCGAVVVGWLIFPFAHALPPPDPQRSKVFLRADEAFLHQIERLSEKVGPKDAERKFELEKYIRFKEEARTKYEQRKAAAAGEVYYPPEPSGKLSPGESIKKKKELYEEAGG